MESVELREQTASERLSLEEEYAMQQTWLHDEKKCTFIVLDKNLMDKSSDEVESMIGDANLYLKDSDDGIIGEIGLMIAEENYRGEGRGKETALLLFRYAIQEINVNLFEAIISMNNLRSIKMFEHFNFERVNESKVFNEITLSKKVTEDFVDWILRNTENYKTIPTIENT